MAHPTIGIDIRPLMHRPYSGVASYTISLLEHLFAVDSDSHYKLFYNAQRDVRPSLPSFNFPHVEYCGFRYPNKLFNLSTEFLGLPRVDRLIGNVDTFWMPNMNFIGLSPKTRRILTIHDLSFIRFPEFFSPKQRLWHQAIFPKKQIVQSSHLIAVSESTKNDIIDLCNVAPEKITVIHSGISPYYAPIEPSHPFAQRLKEAYSLPEQYVLYMGTLEPRKNIESIIRAFSLVSGKFPELHLVIAGGNGWKTKSIYEAANSSPAANHVVRERREKKIIFTGYVEESLKPALYSQARAFLFPSLYEGFGFPPLEAQACGTPVISSANSSLCEILGNSALLVNPFDVQELAFALESLLTTPTLHQNYRRKGFENVKRFTWEKAAKETLEILRK